MKINLCSLGNPLDPGYWSGTPFKIYSEIQKRGQIGKVFSSDLTGVPRKIISLFSVPFYRKDDLTRTPVIRYCRAAKVERITGKAATQHTLHTSSLSLPFIKKPDNQHHYLFCDSTWNLWSKSVADKENYSNKLISHFDRIEAKAFLQFDHIFTISEYVKENLINYYNIFPGKITVVNTGLGIIQPFFGQKDYSNRKILFAAKGRFKDKGGEMVIAAFRKALETDPDLKLTIMGGAGDKDISESPNVSVKGFIPQEEAQELFNTHTLFLMPANNEPWGLVYLEAMACKMPIVGLNRNSFPEISGYGKYGFGIDDNNSDLLAKILIDSYRDPARLKSIGESAQKNCLSQYSWEKTVSKILNIIERIDENEKSNNNN